ncbi:MAG: hypothetical protein Ctma_0686 [Catillopecten margaritatus gill symbiont]|uniref:Addiction module toxin RelE n=1 Tax=Catillopecten margaritatus gill symbiont TaxID=3083288 RepID=A0AAU6PG79_9GAMM
MKPEILEIHSFKKSVKKLAKKYKRFADDYEGLINTLELGNHNAVDLGDNFYKIRLKNSSSNQGKSGGFRIVYFFKALDNEIYLLDIFSKSDIDTIKKPVLQAMIEKYVG